MAYEHDKEKAAHSLAEMDVTYKIKRLEIKWDEDGNAQCSLVYTHKNLGDVGDEPFPISAPALGYVLDTLESELKEFERERKEKKEHEKQDSKRRRAAMTSKYRQSSVGAKRSVAKDGLDDYPTTPWATRALLEYLTETIGLDLSGKAVWEPAANRGFMVDVLEQVFKKVYASDVHDYGHGFKVADFLRVNTGPKCDWMITNPPFNRADKFALKALDLGIRNFALLCRVQWLEGIGRYDNLFSYRPPAKVVVFTERMATYPGRVVLDASSATAYAWFIWNRKSTRQNVSTVVDWLPPGSKKRFTYYEDDLFAYRSRATAKIC